MGNVFQETCDLTSRLASKYLHLVKILFDKGRMQPKESASTNCPHEIW